MVLSVADAKKLTVPRLKEELASRGLDNTGNKPELLARLTESIEQAADELLGDAGITSDTHLLSDDILNDDILDAPSVGDESEADKLLGSVDGAEEHKTDKSEGEEKHEVHLIDKKIDEVTAETDKRARAIRFGLPVTAEDLGSDGAKAARAKRFDLPEDSKRLTSNDAKASRAERFGITPKTPAADDKLAARAARFGIPVGGAASASASKNAPKSEGKAAKLAARAKRFGGEIDDEEMEAKKKARMERFGTSN